MPKILAFAGSTRAGSYNQKVLAVAAEGARQAGVEVNILDLKEFPLPLFDEDLEAEGSPVNVRRLRELFKQHDALLIASPEYNSSITPLMKNTIDWVSRAGDGDKPLAAYQGKVAALLAASPGGLGGLRGLVHLRAILGNIGVIVLPEQFALGKAGGAFDDEGRLLDPNTQSRVRGIGQALAEAVLKLKG